MPIQRPSFDAVAAWGIGSLSCLMTVIWVWVLARGRAVRASTLGLGAVAVLGVSAAAAASGLLARFDLRPPPMAIMMPAVLVLGGAIGLGAIGRAVAGAVPLATLVGVQAFRLPLELVMHHAASVGVMPPELSFSGYNFDIVTGATALVLFVAFRIGVPVPRAAIWAWNLWGIACLGVIVIVAVLSSPMVLAFGDDPRHVNTWVLFFPYVWLPVVLVSIAVSGHIILTRALIGSGKDRPRPA